MVVVDREKKQHLRPILVAPVEDEKRVRLAKEILFIKLVGTELHGGNVLENNRPLVSQKTGGGSLVLIESFSFQSCSDWTI